MSPLYLRRIEISNFRAYGDLFSLSLPGPGVTILTGPDGLGKSTFFESIEWALTGKVRRLEAPTQEGLDRGRDLGLLARSGGDVPVAQYRVSLEFMNGEAESSRIERLAVREPESRERFAEASAPTPQHLMDLLRAGSWEHEIRDIGEQLRLTHLGEPPGTATTELQAIVDVDARRRAAESRRDTLLLLKAAREKVTQGAKQKSLPMGENDRHTHEMWMVQPHLTKTTKTLKKIAELDSRIHSLRLSQQEIESCQQAYELRQEAIQSNPLLTGVAWEQIPSHLAELRRSTQSELESAQSTRDQQPDPESLKEEQARLQERVEELSSAIKENHKIIAQIEQALSAEEALLKQHPELLSALGKLPEDEAKALDEAERAVEQLVQEERQLAQSGVTGLLSRSTAHPWSRWPALLLDEHLQPQDLLHPAAFTEVLRQLVLDRRYQVILSIRDEQLADTMRSKMEKVGIECVTCRYSGLGPTGVLYSTV